MTLTGQGSSRYRRIPHVGAAVSVIAGIVDHPANERRRTRAVARAVAAQTKWRLRAAPSVVPFGRSSRVLAVFDGGSSQRAAYAPLPDYPEMTAWQRHLSPGELFVDVGANSGLYTLLACEIGCDVIAVEPLCEMVDQLRANLALNGYHAEVIERALGAAVGTTHVSGPDSQRSHLSDNGREVTMTTLDDLVGDRTIHGLKVDVEGAERLVLEGASRLLEEHRVQLAQIEWNDRAEVNFGETRQPLIDMLDGFGYTYFRPDATGVLRPSAPNIGADVFVRPIEQES